LAHEHIILCHDTLTNDWLETNSYSPFTPCNAVACERVLKRITGGLIALAPATCDTSGRREKHEKVHASGEYLVQVPGSLQFGCDCEMPILDRHVA
jgi:hypothetical protein